MKVVVDPLEALEPLPVEPREPLPVDEPAGDDPGEALIKEAKQRARRRRLLYGAIAVVVAIAAVTAFTIPTSSTPPPNDATPPVPTPPVVPPPVVDPDASSTLLTSYWQFHLGYVFVYADGRVISHPDIGVWLDAAGRPVGYSAGWQVGAPEWHHEYRDIQRRLNQRGLELVRVGRIVPTDLLSSIISLSKEELDAYAEKISRTPIVTSDLWAEPTATVYEPSHYAVCFLGPNKLSPAAPPVPSDLAQGVAQLPAPAQALLHGKEQHNYDPSIDAASSLPPRPCFKITSAEATSLLQMFNHKVIPGNMNAVNLGVVNNYMTVSPIYPHGQYVFCGGCG
jgi:hypothetical protein